MIGSRDFQDRVKQALMLPISGHQFIAHFSHWSWGDAILIMEKSGKACGRLYMYSDDNDSVYLDSLSVDEIERKNGLGRTLQEMREEFGVWLGATTSFLFVEKNTWMHDWYQRRGYTDWEDFNLEENTIWMKKSLTTKN